MNTTYLQNFEPVTFTETETSLALETGRRLVALLNDKSTVKMQILEQDVSDEVLVIPSSAMRLLARILSEMAQGNPVALTTIHTELSTQQAADLLNVSRPYLVQLLEKDAIPYRKVGTHRRVMFDDVMRYKNDVKAKRRKVLEELTAQAQELDLGY